MDSIPDEPQNAQARLARATEIVDDLQHLAWLGISQRIADDLNLPLPVILIGQGSYMRRWPDV